MASTSTPKFTKTLTSRTLLHYLTKLRNKITRKPNTNNNKFVITERNINDDNNIHNKSNKITSKKSKINKRVRFSHIEKKPINIDYNTEQQQIINNIAEHISQNYESMQKYKEMLASEPRTRNSRKIFNNINSKVIELLTTKLLKHNNNQK